MMVIVEWGFRGSWSARTVHLSHTPEASAQALISIEMPSALHFICNSCSKQENVSWRECWVSLPARKELSVSPVPPAQAEVLRCINAWNQAQGQNINRVPKRSLLSLGSSSDASLLYSTVFLLAALAIWLSECEFYRNGNCWSKMQTCEVPNGFCVSIKIYSFLSHGKCILWSGASGGVLWKFSFSGVKPPSFKTEYWMQGVNLDQKEGSEPWMVSSYFWEL